MTIDLDYIDRQVYEMLGPRNYLIAAIARLILCVAVAVGIVWLVSLP